jgi:hypothetical protein
MQILEDPKTTQSPLPKKQYWGGGTAYIRANTVLTTKH